MIIHSDKDVLGYADFQHCRQNSISLLPNTNDFKWFYSPVDVYSYIFQD